MIEPNELPPANGLATIIIQQHRDQRGEILTHVFARGDTGQLIGFVQGQLARFGCGSGMSEFFFLDENYAIQFIKNSCKEYLGRTDIDFQTRSADRLIQVVDPNKGRTRM